MKRWSLHTQLQPFELITSWIKRLSMQYLNDIPAILGTRSLRGIHYDGFDHRINEDLLDRLNSKTGISKDIIQNHAFVAYDTHFPKIKGIRIKWREGMDLANKYSENFIQSMRRAKNGAIRYCPHCLQESIPYFRMYWKLGYYLVCHIHHTKMLDQCPECQSTINYMRENKIYECRSCSFDLRLAITESRNPDLVLKVHKLFWDLDHYELEGEEANQVLGHIWELYCRFHRVDTTYRHDILLRYNNRIPNNEFDLNYSLLELSYQIVLERSGNLDQLVPCDECSKWMSSIHGLTSHKRYHGEKENICGVCKDDFHTEYELERHSEIHDIDNFNCLYCNIPYRFQKDMTQHLHVRHQSELLMDIEAKIEEFSKNGSKIAYVTISKEIGFSRSLFNNFEIYKKLVMDHNDLRVSYMAVMKLPREVRITKQLKIVKEAVKRLESKNKDITYSSVGREIGINRNTLSKTPEISKYINSIRTGKGGFNIQVLSDLVLDGIRKLKEDHKDINYKTVAKEIELDTGTISTKPEIRVLIEANRTS